MRIAAIGDVHGHRERLERVLRLLAPEKPDLTLLPGDLALDPPWEEPARARERERHDESFQEVISDIRTALACPIVFVPGNHDLPEPPAGLEADNADGRIAEAAGLRIAGLGGSGPHHFGFPYEWTEEEADATLSRIFGASQSVEVLLCHAPPLNCKLDRMWDGKQVGSHAVTDWIKRAQPQLFVCGHIHEAHGVEWREGVPCLNAGALGDPFGRELGWLIDWERGPVQLESILHDGGKEYRQQWLE